jgi:hypothetical protein
MSIPALHTTLNRATYFCPKKLHPFISTNFDVFFNFQEEEIVAAKKKADELEMENVDLSNRLAKKEQELDQKTQEKVSPCQLRVLFCPNKKEGRVFIRGSRPWIMD